MLMDICLPTFHIYQSRVVPNLLKSHLNSWCPEFFQTKVLSNARSEVFLVRRKKVSTGQYIRAFKTYISRLVLFTYPRSILFLTLYRYRPIIGVLRWFYQTLQSRDQKPCFEKSKIKEIKNIFTDQWLVKQ